MGRCAGEDCEVGFGEAVIRVRISRHCDGVLFFVMGYSTVLLPVVRWLLGGQGGGGGRLLCKRELMVWGYCTLERLGGVYEYQ